LRAEPRWLSLARTVPVRPRCSRCLQASLRRPNGTVECRPDIVAMVTQHHPHRWSPLTVGEVVTMGRYGAPLLRRGLCMQPDGGGRPQGTATRGTLRRPEATGPHRPGPDQACPPCSYWTNPSRIWTWPVRSGYSKCSKKRPLGM